MPKTIASSTVCVLLVAYIIYAFLVPPEWARRDPAQVQGPTVAELREPLALNATFTTAGRINFEDLTLTFKYPSFWEYGELHSDQVDATVPVIRPGNDPVHAGITLLVTRSPTAFVPSLSASSVFDVRRFVGHWHFRHRSTWRL